MNKDLIQQAAEEYCFQVPYNGTNEFYNKEKLEHYGPSVTHFLSYAKENGYELLRVENNELAKNLNDYVKYAHTQEECVGYIDGFNSGYALGAAKERERMKGVMEKASEEGWNYIPADRLWRRLIKNTNPVLRSIGQYEEKTTDELINHYQNKEG